MTINAVKRVDPRNKSYVYIHILCIINRKKYYSSTGIKIHKDFWDDDRRKVKKNQKVDYDLFNKIIREKIEEVRLEKKGIIVTKTDKKSSFLWYLDQEINRLDRINSPSLAKYKTTKKHLTNFKDSINQNDILFSQINYSWIRDFEDFMNEKGLSQNTRTGYLKKVQKIYREAIKDETFNTSRVDPFSQYKFKTEIVPVEYLSKEHIKKLSLHDYPKGSRLQNTKHRFLFQFFGNGMRSSDMFFMRFKNIKFNKRKTRLEFTQFKTKIPHSVLIDDNLMKQLFYFIDIDKYYEMYYEREFDCLIGGSHQRRTLTDWKNHFNYLHNILNCSEEELIPIKKFINETLKEIYFEQLEVLKQLYKTKKNDFIIPIINNKVFERAEFNSKHNHTKKQKSHHSGRLTLYNRYLKDLDDVMESSIKLVSHTARHTFANVQLNNGVGVYAISKALGHQDIRTTQIYLENFNSELIDRQLNWSNEKLKYEMMTDIY